MLRGRARDVATRGRAASTSLGAALCALGLGGLVFALIEQPRYGWGSPAICVPLLGGLVAFGAFLAYERRASAADAAARSVRAAATSRSGTSRR